MTADHKYFAIDFYDGQNAVAILGFDKENPAPGELPSQGTLTRDAKQILQYSAPHFGDLLFLVGHPVTEQFTPDNSTLRDGPNDTVILERNITDELPKIMRLTLSKKTWRPVMLDDINQANHKVMVHYAASEFKSYPGATQFSGKVTITTLAGNGTVVHTEDYQVIKAAFNKAANLTELRVSPGTNIEDARFGGRNTVGYTLNTQGVLPTDARIRELLKEEGKVIEAKAEDQTSKTTPNAQSTVALALGLFLMVGGVGLWKKSQDE